jgi:hypothetical protein
VDGAVPDCFEADDNAQWRRVADSADPLIMLRQ